jgi:hypothetical protein
MLGMHRLKTLPCTSFGKPNILYVALFVIPAVPSIRRKVDSRYLRAWLSGE